MKKLLSLLLILVLAACAPQAQEAVDIDAPSAFTSEDIIIGEGGEWAVNGILTIPDGRDNLPAVVLVQGSGWHDMDETIFGNKPFRDIAEYLSANGIAVLRHDMRHFAHNERMLELGGSVTLWEERMEDTVLAAELLKADPRIDESRVFILGHSLGGMLAPRIHAEGGDFAGLIIFAGSPRFLLDISRDQSISFLESMYEGEELETRTAQLVLLHDMQVNAYLNMSEEEAKKTDLGGMSVYYIIDMYNNPVEKFIADITAPMLVMHPENDAQVCIEKDFGALKELLADRDNVTFKLYPGLNHLFMPGERVGIAEIMEQYEIPGKVDEQVLADITEWIHAN
jgi:hypothetical protein